MPIPSYTEKPSLGSQVIYIRDGNIFTDNDANGEIPLSIADINARTREVLPEADYIEYFPATTEPDPELQRYLDEKK
ncbi:MAG: hypothetical protein UY04_C0015G0030 [Parcubacteria group bacterium GW2011_GWA2_47_7]|nr:MAG: hypothetical protein UY04_C0015G0030 [Parcubacteria group bacterium GW2011_GWA2_47_7]